jgi:hypothetical protein
MASDRPWARWSERVLGIEGSTRSAALIRIATPLLVWSGWGTDLIFCRDLSLLGFVLCASFWISTSAMLVGYKSSVASAWAGATSLVVIAVFGSLHRRDMFVHHHTTLLAFVMLFTALTPCGGSYSVDRLLAVRRAEARGEPAPEERGSLWGLRLVALQLSAVYFWGAVDKTTVPFLSGERMEAILVQYYFDLDLPRWSLFHPLVAVTSVATAALEYALAIGLWIPRFRRRLMLAGLVFHAIIYLILPVQTFSLAACLLYVAFLPPDEVHAFIDRYFGRAHTARA